MKNISAPIVQTVHKDCMCRRGQPYVIREKRPEGLPDCCKTALSRIISDFGWLYFNTDEHFRKTSEGGQNPFARDNHCWSLLEPMWSEPLEGGAETALSQLRESRTTAKKGAPVRLLQAPVFQHPLYHSPEEETGEVSSFYSSYYSWSSDYAIPYPMAGPYLAALRMTDSELQEAGFLTKEGEPVSSHGIRGLIVRFRKPGFVAARRDPASSRGVALSATAHPNVGGYICFGDASEDYNPDRPLNEVVEWATAVLDGGVNPMSALTTPENLTQVSPIALLVAPNTPGELTFHPIHLTKRNAHLLLPSFCQAALSFAGKSSDPQSAGLAEVKSRLPHLKNCLNCPLPCPMRLAHTAEKTAWRVSSVTVKGPRRFTEKGFLSRPGSLNGLGHSGAPVHPSAPRHLEAMGLLGSPLRAAFDVLAAMSYPTGAGIARFLVGDPNYKRIPHSQQLSAVQTIWARAVSHLSDSPKLLNPLAVALSLTLGFRPGKEHVGYFSIMDLSPASVSRPFSEEQAAQRLKHWLGPGDRFARARLLLAKMFKEHKGPSNPLAPQPPKKKTIKKGNFAYAFGATTSSTSTTSTTSS